MKILLLIKKDIKLMFTNKTFLSLYALPYLLFILLVLAISENNNSPNETLFFSQLLIFPTIFELSFLLGAYEFESNTIEPLYSCKLNLKILLVSKILCVLFLLQITSQILYFLCVGFNFKLYFQYTLLTFILYTPLIAFGTIYGYFKRNYNKVDFFSFIITFAYTLPPMIVPFTHNSYITKILEILPSTQLTFLLISNIAISYIIPLVWGFVFFLIFMFYYHRIKQEYVSSPFGHK